MKRRLVATLALLLLASACVSADAPADHNPFADFTTAWRNDKTWYDGKAEYATYDATRVIYGKPRAYVARIITNKELADPNTKTKSATDTGREVFKHHTREDAPTENYTYHFSTMVYVGTSDLKSLKIDMGSMEDCGASYKQFVNHAGTCTWKQSTYFPNEGFREGSYTPPADFVFHDALPVVLRGYPFDRPLDAMLVQLLPDQTNTHLTDAQPAPATIAFAGKETLDLPIGKVDAYHLVVTPMGAGSGPAKSSSHYWFHADATAPWLHIVVQYQGPDGTTYRLRETKRWAYWKH